MGMHPENNICAEQLMFLSRLNDQAQAGSPLAAVALRKHRRAFAATLREPLGLTKLGEVVLGRLATASPTAPLSDTTLESYVSMNVGNVGYLSDGMLGLNRIMPREVGLRIFRMTGAGQDQQWFLAPKPNLKRLDLQIMNCLVAGFLGKETAEKIGIKLPRIKGRLGRLYKRLGVKGELNAALLLVEDDLLDTKSLKYSYDWSRLDDLTLREHEVLEALIGDCGRTNLQIAELLGITVRTVKNHIVCIQDKLGISYGMNRVGLGVGYWLYKNGIAKKPDPVCAT